MRGEKLLQLPVEKAGDQSLGMRFGAIIIRTCNNGFIFYFIEQLPPGMPPTLY